MQHNNPPSHEQDSDPANETELDGLLVQAGMAVKMGGQAEYYENGEGEMTGMLPPWEGSEVLTLAPEAAAKLRIRPEEQVSIGFTEVTAARGSEALVEVINPHGEDYVHYIVEKIPNAHGGSKLKGIHIDTAFNQLKRERDMELGDFDKFPPKHDLTEKDIEKGMKATSSEEVEAGKPAEFLDIPVTDEAGQTFVAAGEGRPLTTEQVDALGELIGALTHIPPARPEA